VKCPVCDNDQFGSKKLTSEITLFPCSNCDFLISQINRSQAIQSEFSLINDAEYQRSIGQVRRHQAHEILRLVQPYTKPGSEWLDVGCSFGYLLYEAKRVGFQVAGIEPDEKAVVMARSLVGEATIQHGIMADPIRADSSVDVVSMLDVLEHIPSDRLSDFARMLHRKLRPDGLWVIKVPSTEGLYFTLAHQLLPFAASVVSGVIKRLWQSEYEYPHTVYFNQKTLTQFLDRHGYEVLKVHYLDEVPNRTVMDRLRMDNTIPKWQTIFMAPVLYSLNFIEHLRGKSDALLVIARRR